jgi:glycosyltransferase involved in cell wall biosynthesis
MKKVLIITYYWPPSGGSSVLRWLKFTKYLRSFGWEPVIYTPANPEPQEIDQSLLKNIPENLEIIKTKIYEPYSLYKWLTGKKQSDRLGVALMSDNKKPGFISKFSLWIRSNLFIPDPRRFWVNPSIRLLSRYLKANPVDIIVSTGPPHSMHLIGLGLKRKLGVKWVADFRDPWTNIDFYTDLLLTTMADHCHKKLEKSVLRGADFIITVSPGMTEEFKNMGIMNLATITNGYDEEPLSALKPEKGKFTIVHLGSMPKSRNPENLWHALSNLVKGNPGFASQLQIRLIGKTDRTVHDSIALYKLNNYLVQEEFVPHDQTMELLTNAAVLLLCINNTPNAKGILTNKFFEYLSAQRPIVALGPKNGDAALILQETGAGSIFDYKDTDLLSNHVLALFELYSQDKLAVNSSNIEKYSRKNLTRQLSELLNKITN